MFSNLVIDVNMVIWVEYDIFVRVWDMILKWIIVFVVKVMDLLDKGIYDFNDFYFGFLILFVYVKKYLVLDGNYVGWVLMGYDIV